MPDIREYMVSIAFKSKGAKEAKEDEEKVSNGLDKINNAAGKMSKGLQGAFKGLSVITKINLAPLKLLGKAISMVGVKNLIKDTYELTKKTSDYIETVNLFRTSMGSLAEEAEKFRNEAENKLGLDPSAVMDALSSFQNLSEGFGIASDRAYIMSQNLSQLAGDLSSFANISYSEAQQKLMSGFSGQVMPLRKYGIALDQASLQELAYSLGIDKRVKSMTRAQKTELIYYQIMKSTQKMQGDLARTLMSPSNATRVLKNEFESLARAVGSIFIPVLQKTIPIIRAVTKALTQAATAIAQFFGFNIENYLVSFSDADDVFGGLSDDIEDIGDSADGTTKKLNKMLMPFDELNNITSSSGSGSGSGVSTDVGGSLGIELPTYDMFEGINDRFETFENVTEKIKQTIEKINEILRNIPWNEVKEFAGNLGKEFTGFWNEIIGTVDWYTVGQTVSETINTLFEFIYNAVKEFDWVQAGEAIGEYINGVWENFDAVKAGEALGTAIKGVLESIGTILKTVNWKTVGRKIVEFIKGLNLIELINKISDEILPLLFQAIFDLIVGMFEGLDPAWQKGILATLGGIAAAFVVLTGPVGLVAAAIAALIGVIVLCVQHWDDIKEVAKKVWDGIVEIWGNVWGWFDDHILKPIKLLVQMLKVPLAGMKVFFAKILEKIVNNVIDSINVIIRGINYLGDVLGFHLNEISRVSWAEDAQKEYDEILKETIKMGIELYGNVDETLVDINDVVEKGYDKLTGKVKKSMTSMNDIVTGKFEKAVEKAQESMDEMALSIEIKGKKAEQTTGEFMSNINNTIGSQYELASEKAKSSLSNLEKANETTGNNMKTKVSTYMTNINDTITSKYELASQKAKSSLSNLEKANETTGNNMKTKVSTYMTNIYDTITSKYELAKQKASKSVDELEENTEKGFDKLNKSSIFQTLNSKLETLLNKANEARNAAQQTAQDYEQGLIDNIGTQQTSNSIANKLSHILNLKYSAYYWGQDLMEGLKNGINDAKGLAIQAAAGVAQGITSYLHFSRPDKGPLREYESWMPDMIKGLSESLISAKPIIENAVSMISNEIADSIMNIRLPEVNESVFVNQNQGSVIANIGSRTTNANKENVTSNLIRATYEAVSRALTENTSNPQSTLVQVNLGGKEIYKGYGQFKDEQSNKLGITI